MDVTFKEQSILHRHNLKHIPELRVHENVFAAQFTPNCAVSNCDAACCRYGVFADIGERDAILAHVEMIQWHMEPHQVKDSSKWFEDREREDTDFPSGKAIGTQAMDYGCVFLDSVGRCTLQKAAIAEGMHPFALKPFYCVAYPVTVDHGELMVDDAEFVDRPQCCRPTESGTLDILDVCADELEHVLGKEGVEELRTMFE